MSDPREHRHVTAVNRNRIRYACGCFNEISEPHGVLRSVSKCAHHASCYRDPERLGVEYFIENGVLDKDGKTVLDRHYIDELFEALGPFPTGPTVSVLGNSIKLLAMEVGCGISPYAGELQRRNWNYIGIEPCRFAAEWMKQHYNVPIHACGLEQFEYYNMTRFLLAAHCLEHMKHAPWAIMRCAEILLPQGEFWIIVPDDSDPLNPDHRYFFSTTTLARCLEANKLVVEKMVVRKRIERENFIYCVARKP